MGDVLPFRRVGSDLRSIDQWEARNAQRIDVYTYACPTCKARQGDWCRSRTGRRTNLHSARCRRVWRR